jgi:hypothetical protein
VVYGKARTSKRRLAHRPGVHKYRPVRPSSCFHHLHSFFSEISKGVPETAMCLSKTQDLWDYVLLFSPSKTPKDLICGHHVFLFCASKIPKQMPRLSHDRAIEQLRHNTVLERTMLWTLKKRQIWLFRSAETDLRCPHGPVASSGI